MPVSKGELFTAQNVYIDYDYENVMFRWDCIAKSVHRRFYGKAECGDAIPTNNKLFNDALRFGVQITKEEYEKGK
jgi:hypothetical protein